MTRRENGPFYCFEVDRGHAKLQAKEVKGPSVLLSVSQKILYSTAESLG